MYTTHHVCVHHTPHMCVHHTPHVCVHHKPHVCVHHMRVYTTHVKTNFIFTGLDCSIQSSFIQWSDYTNDNNTGWGSGGHSNVYWNQSLWLFGGYVLPSLASSVVDGQVTSSPAALWRCVEEYGVPYSVV